MFGEPAGVEEGRLHQGREGRGGGVGARTDAQELRRTSEATGSEEEEIQDKVLWLEG